MRPGPKYKVDAAAKIKVLGILEGGGTLADAADLLGIGYKTLKRSRLADAEFDRGVLKAIRIAKMRLIKKMGKAKPWQAAAWMLERRWGKEYGKKDHLINEHRGQVKFSPITFDGEKEPTE